MLKQLKRFWKWLRMDDGDDNPWLQSYYFFKPLKYSENIEKFPIHGKVSDDDIIQMSHKLENGKYETCYISMKALKEYINNDKDN